MWGGEPSLQRVLSAGPALAEPGEEDSAAGGSTVKQRLVGWASR